MQTRIDPTEFQQPLETVELGEMVRLCSILIPRHRRLRADEQRMVREMLRPFVVRGE